jgi:8-hydroxy-5-deazaflavin:NADPH oxidoreductase
MRIAVLGTGIVGRTLAAALAGRGHDLVVGTRDVDATATRPDVAEWQAAHPGVRLVPLGETAAHGEVVVNATSGEGTVAAVGAAGDVAGKVVADVSNALDFSAGFPPTLSVANTDSIGEQLQRAFPDARVVKTLNTMNASVMADPSLVPGEHHVFVAGDDAEAKAVVTGLLTDLGWPATSVLDLGGIRAARSTEMYLPLWLSLMGVAGSPAFNIRLVRG